MIKYTICQFDSVVNWNTSCIYIYIYMYVFVTGYTFEVWDTSSPCSERNYEIQAHNTRPPFIIHMKRWNRIGCISIYSCIRPREVKYLLHPARIIIRFADSFEKPVTDRLIHQKRLQLGFTPLIISGRYFTVEWRSWFRNRISMSSQLDDKKAVNTENA